MNCAILGKHVGQQEALQHDQEDGEAGLGRRSDSDEERGKRRKGESRVGEKEKAKDCSSSSAPAAASATCGQRHCKTADPTSLAEGAAGNKIQDWAKLPGVHRSLELMTVIGEGSGAAS